MPGQQGGVHVDGAARRDFEDRARDDLAVRDHHDQLGRQRAQAFDHLGVTDALGLVELEPALHGRDLHRRRGRLHPVAGPVGLSDHQQDVVTCYVKGLERRHGKLRRADEDELQEGASALARGRGDSGFDRLEDSRDDGYKSRHQYSKSLLHG